MIKTLILFILSCIRVSLDILRIAIIKALFPRMPPRNWRKENISVVQPDHDFTNGDKEAARFEIPNPFTKYAVLINNVNVITPTKPSIVEFEFSFYSNTDSASAAPQDTRHPFLTPVRPPPIKEVGFTILRNASDRVTEILQERRRRLDAGEDPDTIRKAARRKRTIELSAVR